METLCSLHFLVCHDTLGTTKNERLQLHPSAPPSPFQSVNDVKPLCHRAEDARPPRQSPTLYDPIQLKGDAIRRRHACVFKFGSRATRQEHPPMNKYVSYRQQHTQCTINLRVQYIVVTPFPVHLVTCIHMPEGLYRCEPVHSLRESNKEYLLYSYSGVGNTPYSYS